jgi:hypothetical protein
MIISGVITFVAPCWIHVMPDKPLKLECIYGPSDFVPYLPNGQIKIKYGEFSKMMKLPVTPVKLEGARIKIDCKVRVNKRVVDMQPSKSITIIPVTIMEFEEKVNTAQIHGFVSTE